MKKQFTNVMCLGLMLTALGAGSTQAQTIWSEDFQGVTTSGGTGDLPGTWVQHNVDGLTPANNVSFMGTSAWKVRDASGSKFAASTSWYTPAGISNDWMVTPSISIPGTGTPYLMFKVYAPDANYPDGYQVYVSTTGTNVADFGVTPVFSEAAAPSGGFTQKVVPLTSYLGDNIHIAFRNNSNDMFLLYVDDIEVRMLPANEVVLNSVSVNRYSLTSTNNTLSLNVTNMGASPITSLDVTWTDGVTPHTSTITGLNIATGVTQNVNHPTPVNFATAVEKNLTVNITQVNGVADSLADNNGSANFNTVSSIKMKKVLVEEGTGTWCGWCPRGAIAMAYMTANYPVQFVGIAVHNGDPMTVTAYDNGVSLSGYPGCNVDRTLLDQGVSQSAFVQYYNSRKDLIVPAGLTVSNTYDFATRDLSVTVDADFVTPYSAANLRLAVVVVEDSVTGTSSGYNQTNYYANNANGPMGGYESLPNPVPASQMVYDHVGRVLLGGFSGQTGSVPTTLTDGQTVSYTFTYTLPATIDDKHVKLVGLLIDQTNGQVINAEEIHMMTPLSVDPIESNIAMTLFPNPTSDFANVKLELKDAQDITLSVFDLSGKVVYNHNYGNLSGTQMLNVPVSGFAKGTYIVSVSSANRSYNKQLIVK